MKRSSLFTACLCAFVSSTLAAASDLSGFCELSEALFTKGDYTLNQSYDVDTFVIDGATLKCPDDPSARFTIKTRQLNVTNGGSFICGTPEKPFLGELNIILTGDETNKAFPEERSFVVEKQATVSFHGRPVLSWAELEITAAKGARSLTLTKIPLNWEVTSLFCKLEICQINGKNQIDWQGNCYFTIWYCISRTRNQKD
jgi:hypothetical protein